MKRQNSENPGGDRVGTIPAECAGSGRRTVKEVLSRFSEEVEANFSAWFKRNCLNRRAGRIGDITYDRAGELDDRPGDQLWYTFAYDRAYYDHTDALTIDEMAFLFNNPLIAFQIAVGITDFRGLRCLRRGISMNVNRLQRKFYRSRYYMTENARRRLRREEERRKIRRRVTSAPCPTPAEFRTAFARVGESLGAKIFFGGMVHDLECYVDNRLRIDARGEIVGRNRGIRGWLADNLPDLAPRYKTIMRYKALAMRVRQATNTKDPTPTSALLAVSPAVATAFGPPETANPAAGERSETPGTTTAAEAEKVLEILRANMPPRGKNVSGAAGAAAAARGAGSGIESKNYSANNSRRAVMRDWGNGVGRGSGEMMAIRVVDRTLAKALEGCPNTMRACFIRVDRCLEGDHAKSKKLRRG